MHPSARRLVFTFGRRAMQVPTSAAMSLMGPGRVKTLKVRKSWRANWPGSRSRCPSRKPRAPSRHGLGQTRPVPQVQLTPEPDISKTDEISQLKAALQGLQQSQQGTAVDLRRDQEMLQAQQADIKRLSEEVAQLAAKLDLLQGSARDAQASAPPPVQRPVPKKPASKPAVREPASPTPLSVSPEEKK